MNRILYIIYIGIVLSLLGCCRDKVHLQNGDLIFEVAGESAAAKAIDAATAIEGAESFSHVGIIEVGDNGCFVIEAVGDEGVRRIPLERFLACATRYHDGSSAIVIMRVVGECDVAKCVERAKTHLGEPYDYSYRPDNGSMYCSELVYESYLDKTDKPIFTARPMNFRAADGSMPTYWVELFERLGEPIPQGLLGTNPNDMAREPRLKRVENIHL